MKRFTAAIAFLILVLFLAGTVWSVEDDDSIYRAGLKATDKQDKDDWDVNANMIIGAKALDKDDWEPVESQVEAGLSLDFAHRSWPFNFAVGILGSAIDKDDYFGSKVEGSTSELRLGIKKIWETTSNMRIYVGLGLAVINAKLKPNDSYDEASDDDDGSGEYISGGIYWTLARHFNLGLELGASGATATLFNHDTRVGGYHALFLTGYHW